MYKPKSIAIDGPAGSGKTTIGAALARRLGYLLFDTGVIYRAATLAALRQGVPISDERAVTQVAQSLNLEITAPTADDGRLYSVFLDGEDVTWQLRGPEVDANVSQVSAYPGVRQALLEQQRRVALQGQVVVVGRDIGSVVLPEAELKIYLDASPEERARRREKELRERGSAAAYADILANIVQRDCIDSGRAVAPLRMAAGAYYLDTTGCGIEEVLCRLEQLLCKVGNESSRT
jgi:cytidylate kinase